MIDYYKILGVDRRASDSEIKQAYRKLAMQHHPDRGGDAAKFQQIQEAYNTVGDPVKRQQYDNPAPQFQDFNHGFDFNSIFDIFGAKFHHNIKPQVRVQLVIDLRDVLLGGNQMVQLNTPHGQQTVEISIPRGVDDGDTVKYQGIAPGGFDLLVIFRVRPDPRWIRKGANLHTTCDLSFWELILGSRIPIVNINNEPVQVDVPAGTKPDSTLRLRGQGLPDQSGNRGDIMIKINVKMPERISEELRHAIQTEVEREKFAG